ncbi:fungal specific transcription factor domain-containing protein [Colletotrichum truncatum]|uniref:Fungal specific transcription factor domain-containing protein n=1 Tax=Colletotrichum truncatum TaxID=5467 RepID=A0ACC3Z6X7_COLTU|nr:fungal specific transcription factor domain-containing protein [Colletotrichum truncatum]KAF6781300.1 fungal specific transcription factor domain-containing protein [Colletotrichum truncatum]
MNSPSSAVMADSVSSSSEHPPVTSNQSHSKRIRLSLACNQCRKRKVRCDAQTPKCHNCILRGDDCQTTNPRNPKEHAVRKWASKSSTTQSDNSTHEGSEPARDRHLRTVSPRPRQYLSPAYDNGSEGEDAASRRLSWVAQAYRANVRDNDSGHAPPGHSDLNPDIALNTDESSHRLKFMGGSSVQSLTMFADLFFKKRGLRTLSPYFRFGMHHVEEFQLPLSLQLPSLPPLSTLDAYLDVYMKRVFPLFPVFDETTMRSDMDRLVSLQEAEPSGSLQGAIDSPQVPILVAIYSIICIGADEETGSLTEIGTHFLTAAYGLLAHVISTPYLASVQALVLLTIALRGRSKEGQGWQTLGQAIRIAHSIGLHRHASTKSPHNAPQRADSAPSPGYQGNRKLHGQLWWSCYTLEKLMELETGRPSAIHDSDCDQTLPEPVPVPAAGIAMSIGSSPEGQADRQTIDYFQPWASLTRIISSISAHIYGRSGQAKSPRILLGGTVRLDSALTEWAQSLPPEIRPPGPHSGNVILCETGHKHLAAFLAIHYHHALICLHRAALVFPEAMYRTHINSQADSAGLSTVELSRLRRGADICIGSARAIVRLTGEIADDSTPTPRARGGQLGETPTNRSESVVFTITQPLLSAVALALHILKQPRSRLARSDLELLGIAAQYAEEQYTRVSQNPRFIQACSVLQSNMSEIVSLQAHQHHSSHSSQSHRGSVTSYDMSWQDENRTPREASASDGVRVEMDLMDLELPDLTGMFTEISNTDLFGGVRLEDLWGMLGAPANGQGAEVSDTSWSRS